MKHNKFSKFIERILICLPLIFLGANILYISLNQNAKDSYYGETIDEKRKITPPTLYTGQKYYLNTSDLVFVTSTDFFFTDFELINSGSLQETQVASLLANEDTLKRFQYSGETSCIFYNVVDGHSTQVVATNPTRGIEFSFYLAVLPSNNYISQYFYTYEYTPYSFLNNALPYAMNEFNSLGFGKIDFVGWFVNIFMNNQYNNVYVTFVNSYLNYFLFVECCYFIPMVFYWFIHFGERLVDRFTEKTESW